MSDLIDRQTAIKAMKCISDSICEGESVDALCELPTVELIRCKDCEHFLTDGKTHICYHFAESVIFPEPNDYCSRAERKEE